ncbi:helix-turn-helix domain-containing protein [Thiolapillus sp.]
MTKNETDWAGKVRDLRRRLNLSQDDLAGKLHTNQCTISRWERGVTVPNYRMRTKLEALGCSLAALQKTEMEVIAETAQVLFDCSSQPALLLHPDGTIMAVSSDNEYQPGLKYKTGVKLREQTLPEDMESLTNKGKSPGYAGVTVKV